MTRRRRMQPLTEEEMREIAAVYASGKTLRETAEVTGFSSLRVRDAAYALHVLRSGGRRQGVEYPNRRPAPISPEKRDEIARIYEAGATLRETAAITGVSYGTVRAEVDNRGLLRGRGGFARKKERPA